MRPVLYTFRRCPYAMRARMALACAGVDYEVREVVLRDKPRAMLELSAKGTVPVLQLRDRVLDESLDIVDWALDQHDPHGWRDFDAQTLADMDALVRRCESEFKPALDFYKYADRFPGRQPHEYRADAEVFIRVLEERLSQHAEHVWLYGPRLSYADVAIFPFVRQFAHVDKVWFDATPYTALQHWLGELLASELFRSVMNKYPQWHEGDTVTVFSAG